MKPPDPRALTPGQEATLALLRAAYNAYAAAARPEERDDSVAAYYLRRMREGEVLSRYDPIAFEALRGIPGSATVWEIGGGVGQLGFALAAGGRRVVSVDPNRQCHAALRHAQEVLRAADPATAGRLTAVTAAFPQVDLNAVGPDDAAVVFGCPLYSKAGPADPAWDPACVQAFVDGLGAFRHVLIDLLYFPYTTTQPGDIALRRALFGGFATAAEYSYFRNFPPTVQLLTRA